MALNALSKAKEMGVNFLLPVDTLVTDALDFGAKNLAKLKSSKEIFLMAGRESILVLRLLIHTRKLSGCKNRSLKSDGSV